MLKQSEMLVYNKDGKGYDINILMRLCASIT